MKFTRYKIVQYPDGKYAIRRYWLFGLLWDGMEYGDAQDHWWFHRECRDTYARYDTLEDARKAKYKMMESMLRFETIKAHENQVKEIE